MSLRLGALVLACCLGTVGCSSEGEETPKKVDTGTAADSEVASGLCTPSPASARLFTTILHDSTSICLKVNPKLPCAFTLTGCGGIGGSLVTVLNIGGDKDLSTFKVYDKELTSSTFGTLKKIENTSAMEVAEIPVDTEVTVGSEDTTITFKFFIKDERGSIEIISITTADCEECPGS